MTKTELTNIKTLINNQRECIDVATANNCDATANSYILKGIIYTLKTAGYSVITAGDDVKIIKD